jgi:hypothetical protein
LFMAKSRILFDLENGVIVHRSRCSAIRQRFDRVARLG